MTAKQLIEALSKVHPNDKVGIWLDAQQAIDNPQILAIARAVICKQELVLIPTAPMPTETQTK